MCDSTFHMISDSTLRGFKAEQTLLERIATALRANSIHSAAEKTCLLRELDGLDKAPHVAPALLTIALRLSDRECYANEALRCAQKATEITNDKDVRVLASELCRGLGSDEDVSAIKGRFSSLCSDLKDREISLVEKAARERDFLKLIGASETPVTVPLTVKICADIPSPEEVRAFVREFGGEAMGLRRNDTSLHRSAALPMPGL